MKPKLLIYAHDWAPSIGGIQTVTMDLALGICDWSRTHPDDAWDLTMVTDTPAGEMKDSQLPFEVVRKPSAREFLRLIRATDVLHLAGPALLPLAFARLCKKQTVVVHHGYQSVCPNGLLLFGEEHTLCPGHFMAGKYAKCVQCNAHRVGLGKSLVDTCLTFPRRWLAKQATVNIGVSRYVVMRTSLPRARVIYNGVAAYGSTNLHSTPRSDGLPFFAFVGRLVSEKGVPVLLKATAILSRAGLEFQVWIIGDGPERVTLEQTAAELGIQDRIHFLGNIPQDQVASLIRGVTAVVVPSVYEDIAPTVILEQLMSGTPVIGSDIGGIGELLEGVGLRFRVGDAEGLADCMRRALEGPCTFSGTKESERELRIRFSAGRMVQEHLSLYRDLFTQSRRTASA